MLQTPSYRNISEYLRSYGIRPSTQRTAVMNYLFTHRTHPTVDEIYVALSPSMPTLSKTTVYNTLGLFVERGAARMLTLDERNARYDADISAHAHLRCRVCGRVYDLHGALPPELFTLPRKEGFAIEAAEISYTGVCAGCSGKIL